MLHQAFNEVYTKFKLHFYQEIFRRFQDREASLTTVETFCMESIMALGRPTVNEFATFMCISPPNAAYKVNSLVKKGYIRKVQSPSDRREFHLEVTQKYIDYYNISSNYMSEVMDRIMARFSPEDCGKLEEILTVVSRELMPEVPCRTVRRSDPSSASPLSSTASAVLVFSEFSIPFPASRAGCLLCSPPKRNIMGKNKERRTAHEHPDRTV